MDELHLVGFVESEGAALASTEGGLLLGMDAIFCGSPLLDDWSVTNGVTVTVGASDWVGVGSRTGRIRC